MNTVTFQYLPCLLDKGSPSHSQSVFNISLQIILPRVPRMGLGVCYINITKTIFQSYASTELSGGVLWQRWMECVLWFTSVMTIFFLSLKAGYHSCIMIEDVYTIFFFLLHEIGTNINSNLICHLDCFL